jgi:hypothetical protein
LLDCVGVLVKKDYRTAAQFGREEVLIMTTVDATSEVFMTAFRALPKKAREAVVDKMLNDKEFREDLMDAAIIAQRRKEPSRPLEEYLLDRRKKG